jgi:membrane-bound lytic murein transglycosylase F
MSRARWVLAALAAGAILAGTARPAVAGGRQQDYDDHFRKYSKRFFGIGFDWRLFKAQGMAESSLDPAVTSHRGAKGIMQLMPATYQEVVIKNPSFGDIGDPEWNIAAGIWYARRLWDSWRGQVDQAHHLQFMLGSYNAGRMTVLRAQQMAAERLLDRRIWSSIEQVAPNVPRWSYRETLSYVGRVFRYLQSMDHRGRFRS